MYFPRLILPLALTLFLAASPARAGVIDFTYAGSDPDDPFVTSTGPGSISFVPGKTTLGLADLTAFQFSFTLASSDPALSFSDTFTFTLSDLVSFSATLSGTGQVSTLAFQTGFESPPDGFLAPQFLVARSLNRGGLVSFFGPGDDAQHGTVTVLTAAVPGPSSLVLATLGLLGVLARRPRLDSSPSTPSPA